MTSRRPIPRRLAFGLGGLLLLSACQTPRRILPEDGSVDMLSLLRDRPEYSRFLAAIELSGLAGRIGRSNGAVTLFVPTNDALNGQPAALLALLDRPPATPTAEQRAMAAKLVSANAAYGHLRLTAIVARRGRVTTWDGGTVQINQTGARTATVVRDGVPPGPMRGVIAISRADVLASDGVFHVMSAPILPPA